MLARKVPNARISVFQFQSQWFGKGAVDQRLENVADQLLYQLERLRGVSAHHDGQNGECGAKRISRTTTKHPSYLSVIVLAALFSRELF
jgi:hypothetical protein